jgi:hypothetical protein
VLLSRSKLFEPGALPSNSRKSALSLESSFDSLRRFQELETSVLQSLPAERVSVAAQKAAAHALVGPRTPAGENIPARRPRSRESEQFINALLALRDRKALPSPSSRILKKGSSNL